MTWTITTDPVAVPQLVLAERAYYDLNAIMREIDDARVWAGLHWRHSMRHGDQIGRKVARHVARNFFQPKPWRWTIALEADTFDVSFRAG